MSLFDSANITISEDYTLDDDYILTTSDYYFEFTASNVTFDGNGKTITLDNIEEFEGLFYNKDFSYTTIKNLTIEVNYENMLSQDRSKKTVKVGESFICKNNYGINATETRIENCNVSNGYINNINCGGMIGQYSKVKMFDCMYEGNLESYLHKKEGENSKEILSTGSGGIAGINLKNSVIQRCKFIGDLIGTRLGAGIVMGYAEDCTLEDCIFEGSIIKTETLDHNNNIEKSIITNGIDFTNYNLSDSTYNNISVETVTGNGNGLKVDVTVLENNISSVTMSAVEYGYKIGDVLKIPAGTLGSGTTDLEFTLLAASFSGGSSFSGLYSSGICGNYCNNMTINRCTFKGNLLGDKGSGILGYKSDNSIVGKCTFQGTSLVYDSITYTNGAIITDSSGIIGLSGEYNEAIDCTCNVSILGGFPGTSSTRSSGIIGMSNDYARAIGCSTNATILTGKGGGIFAPAIEAVYAENCHFVGESIGRDTGDKAGGITGEGIRQSSETIDGEIVLTRNIIKNCSSRCKNIIGYSGGIVGGTARECDITNCSVEVLDVNDPSNGGMISKEGNYGGGITGTGLTNSVIDSCYVKCNKLYGTRCGGIIGGSGSHNNVVRNSYVITQNGIDEHSQQSGGIIGGYSNNNTVENCYFVGDIHARYSGGILGRSSVYNLDSEVNIKNVYVVGNIGENSTGSYGTINNEGFIATSGSSGHTLENCKRTSTWNDTSIWGGGVSQSTDILKHIEIIADDSPPDNETVFVSGEYNSTNTPYSLSWELFLSFSDSDTVKNIFSGNLSTTDYTFSSVTTDPNDFDIEFEITITLSNVNLSDISSDQQNNLIDALKAGYAMFYQRDMSRIVVTLTEGSVIATVTIYKYNVPEEIPYSVTSGMNIVGFSHDAKIKGNIVNNVDNIDRVYECDGLTYTELIRDADFYYNFAAHNGYLVMMKDTENISIKYYGETFSSDSITLSEGWNYIGSSVDGGSSSDQTLYFYKYNVTKHSYEVIDNSSLPKDKGYIVHSPETKDITV